ncbi:choline transporter-like 2 [Athalia rosae]|uniref:choline transporter-like 2 n=1 Tax=Athalia rosae TaxID=37344 RepID=UPI0020332658|nr:choline transporter-like 2 [Athalia rosae]
MDDKHGPKLEYDPHWKGPRRNRSCTDWLCLIIFLAFVGGWAGIGYYVFTFGDVNVLLVPTDTEGRKCGVDSDVAGKPYLVFFDLTKCAALSAATNGCDTPQVCVAECPNTDFVWDVSSLTQDLETLRSSMLCKIEIDVSRSTREQLQTYVENNVCARWYLRSRNLARRCIPVTIPEIYVNYTMTVSELDSASQYVKLLVEAEEILRNVYDDFIKTRWTIAAILGCSAVISLIYILLMRWIATPVVFVSIIGICVLLGYSTYRLFLLYRVNYATGWLVMTIICGVLLAIILLVTIFLRSRIRLACQLIGEASKAVLSTTSTLLFPIVPWVLQLSVMVYTLLVAVYVLTIRVPFYTVNLGGNCACPATLNYTDGESCDPDIFNSSCTENGGFCISGGCYLNRTSSPSFINYIHTYNIVGLIWLIFFASAFGEMVLAGTFSAWYWTFRKSDVPFFTLTVSVWRTIRYHLGTLAFGSLIITICRIIRGILEWIDEKLKSYDNELVTFLMKCMKCCFWALEKFLKFINRNAYIMCAIHGKGFCSSARNAFNLLMRNLLRVFVLDKITDWLLFLGKLLIMAGAAWGTWWYTTTHLTDIHYWLVPVVLVAIGSYFLASVFFGVYSAAIDTLFLCFLEDCERNDGSASKPYYMSKSLMKILRKSN